MQPNVSPVTSIREFLGLVGEAIQRYAQGYPKGDGHENNENQSILYILQTPEEDPGYVEAQVSYVESVEGRDIANSRAQGFAIFCFTAEQSQKVGKP